MSWSILGSILFFIMLIGGICFIATIKPKQPKGTAPCKDVYGVHGLRDDAQFSCPDHRQKLIITKPGNYIGEFEYRCQCESSN